MQSATAHHSALDTKRSTAKPRARLSSRLLAAGVLALAGCTVERSEPLFELLPAETTGVTFANELPETPELNIINYLNFYNGGGVAAGDVDGDGLTDLYFTSNLGSDRLYRNAGDFRFEDITERAGVGTVTGWKSGVTMADVNGDGHLDIYVSTVSHLTARGRNVLFINDGDGTFTDRTAEYGLEHEGYSTQAAFFDYDGDGDLDMYLLNHSTHEQRGAVFNTQRAIRHPRAGDRLFSNEGNRFVDVSQAAGVFGGVDGYGLGVVASDLNLDGCPDLFVSNDFDESDFVYINNCDGTFTESLETAVGHTSRSSMGVDAADVDNDGRPDVVVLDMLPAREEILKTAIHADDWTVDVLKRRAGFHPQVSKNVLHLNRGQGRFSEIGYLAGVHATDWSWAPLFADLDNDGDKDLLVTTGIYRRPNDMDFLTFVADREVQASIADGMTDEQLATLLEQMPHVPIPSYAYRNDGDLTFTDMAEPWGLAQPGFSTGAAYVDLNDDGALDLVVNNVNAPAGIYRNRSHEVNGNHHLTVRLQGSGANTAGVGAKVVIRHDGTTQLREQMPTRGFQSSVDPRVHFGLGASATIDSLTVIWPDHRYQVLTDVAADRIIMLSQEDAAERYAYHEAAAEPGLFADVTTQVAVEVRHEENTFFDYNREPLIPHRLSIEGPALAVGDVNGDGLDDVYVGGAKWQAGRLLVQQPDGRFSSTNEAEFQADSLHEDVDAMFFDADGDGDVDLYVVSGGNEFWTEHDALLDRLYRNDGLGALRRSDDALPAFFENGACVVPGDFDADGHLDLFVGGRVMSREYGRIPRSYLLQNDGTGRFRDVTQERAPALAEVGMVTSGAWVDYDDDGRLDLIVAGEWMPIRVFRQEDGRLVDRTAEAGFSGTNGWWNTVAAVDLRGTGRPDLILGNLGLNSRIRASAEEPARLYLHDFSQNGRVEQILTLYNNGVSYPLVGRDELLRTIPQLATRYSSYADFGASRMEDIFPASVLRQAQVREAYLFASAVALNNGDGSFELRPLPTEAQFAPIYAVLPGDFDGDGHADLVVAGNFLGVPPIRGRYDASYGLLLRGDGAGGLRPVDLTESNLVILGEVRDLELLRHADGGHLIVVARNNDTLRMLRPLRLGVDSVSAPRGE
jgi:hypothetical protein